MISLTTAYEIVCCYREIESGEKLLDQINEAISRREVPDLRDGFGRIRHLQLGVPSSDTSTRLFDVAPTLARPVIEAHILQKKAELSALNEKAIIESKV